MDRSNRFTLRRFTVSYNTFHQMWEVITEKEGIEVSYRLYGTKEKAEAFVFSKLANGVEMNTKAIEENGKAVTEMMKLLRARVIQ